MGLGSILLQPQTLQRMQAQTDSQKLIDDIVSVLHQVLVKPENVASVAPAFRRAFEDMGTRLQARMEPGLDAALEQMTALLAPATAAFRNIADEAGDFSNPSDGLNVVSQVMELILNFVEALSDAQLRALAAQLKIIFADTLRLDQALLRNELRVVFVTVRTQLLQDLDQLAEEQAGVHLALAALIGRLERDALDAMPTLNLHPDHLSLGLMQALRRSGFEQVRSQLSCIIGKLKSLLEAGGSVLDATRLGPFGPGSVGAAQPRQPLLGEKFCWYATWLYGLKRREFLEDPWFFIWTTILPTFPSDEVWLNEDRTQLILRRAAREDEVLYRSESGPIDWFDAPQFKSGPAAETFGFGAVGPEFLEEWTRVFSILGDFGKFVAHIVTMSLSPKEYAANIPLSIIHFVRSAASAMADAPLGSFVARKAGAGVGGYQSLFNSFPILAVLGGSFEGIHSKTALAKNEFLQWLTLIGGDALSAYSISSITSTIQDAMLSFWTLINQTGPAAAPDGEDTRPNNREHGAAIIGLASTGANLLLMKVIIPREDYSHPFQGDSDANTADGTWRTFLPWWMVGGTLAGVTGGIVGTFAVWALSRTYDWKQFGVEIGVGALKSFLGFTVAQYVLMEGDTGDGTYNTTKEPDGTVYSPARKPFDGYPPQDSSPYKLPYEKGIAQYMGQGNQGYFSHMRFNGLPQVYAYDFGHDFGDEILASRGGTVVDYFDWIPDDVEPDNAQITQAWTDSDAVMGLNWRQFVRPSDGSTRVNTESWNFIMIRHDAVDSDHDKDQEGVVAPHTYAVYGHGKTGSVREVFNARGVAPRDIIGTVVSQGQVIMHAGDTGVSFHNHLHMHVMVAASDPAQSALNMVTPTVQPPPIVNGGGAIDTIQPIAMSNHLRPYTVPFVFREAGRLKNLTWYTSDNEKVEP